MDSDRILVVDAGNIVEFDHPHILLNKPEGYLRGMVLQTGPETTQMLSKIAKKVSKVEILNMFLINIIIIINTTQKLIFFLF